MVISFFSGGFVSMVETYIITPDYEGVKFLKNYFESLLSQEYQDFRIVIVDNSISDLSLQFIRDNYPEELEKRRIILIKNPENYGFARANNIGIKKAFEDPDCRFIVCLNNDTVLNIDFLGHLVQCAKNHPKAGSIQSKMLWGKNPDIIDSVGIEFSKNGLGFNRGAYEPAEKYTTEEEIFGTCAGAALYRRDALEEVGINGEFFDSDFFAYYEDFDLAFKLRWAGWSSWYCPDAVVKHYKGGTQESRSNFTVYHKWRNYTWNLFKELPNSYIYRNFYRILAAELSQIAINVLRGKFVIFKAKWDAYRGLSKIIDKKNKSLRKSNFEDIEKWFVNRWKEKEPEINDL